MPPIKIIALLSTSYWDAECWIEENLSDVELIIKQSSNYFLIDYNGENLKRGFYIVVDGQTEKLMGMELSGIEMTERFKTYLNQKDRRAQRMYREALARIRNFE